MNNIAATLKTTDAILAAAPDYMIPSIHGTGPKVKAAKAKVVQDYVGVKNVTYVAVASDGTVMTRTSSTMVYNKMVAVTSAEGTGQYAWTGGGHSGLTSQVKNARRVYAGKGTVEILDVFATTAKNAKALQA